SEALHKLQEYDWPGNIRELENVIQRALCFTSAGVLQPEDLHIDSHRVSAPASNSPVKASSESPDTISAYENFRQMQLEQEREFLIKTIRECNGSVREAAQKLGLFRTALYNRLNHLGVNIKEVGSRK
ncbi:MAG: sigma-54-dependent Fis family transcriptional regulator, partial [Fibrobacter sp.]|nr:sigma-54-dependent Fis family transcriptional regulator [Fibrobacter sp.]